MVCTNAKADVAKIVLIRIRLLKFDWLVALLLRDDAPGLLLYSTARCLMSIFGPVTFWSSMLFAVDAGMMVAPSLHASRAGTRLTVHRALQV